MTVQDVAVTSETALFNSLTDILRRQHTSDVTPELREAQGRLVRMQSDPNVEHGIHQMALGLVNLGLGSHDEAYRWIKNALKLAAHDEAVVSNALLAYTSMGKYRDAHDEALRFFDRYQGLPGIVNRVASVMLLTSDFENAKRAYECEMKLSANDTATLEKLERRVDFTELMMASLAQHGYTSEDMIDRLEFAADFIRSNGRNLFWSEFRGTSPNTVTLHLFVDASAAEAANLGFDLAEALFGKFDGRSGVEVAPIMVRALAGRPTKQHSGLRVVA